MSLSFKTSNPQALLSAFKKAIDDEHIVTWSYDAAGDFTHTPPQWRYRAWLRPAIGLGELNLFMVPRKDSRISSEEYAIYHGRYAEAMLAHFDRLFWECSATAMPSLGDAMAA